MKTLLMTFLMLLFFIPEAFCGQRAKRASERLYEEALVAAREGNYDLALKKLKQSAKKDPTNPKLKEFIHIRHPAVEPSARLYRESLDAFLNNDLETAKQKVEACLALNSENAEARRLLDRLNTQQSHSETAQPSARPDAGIGGLRP